ncbi:hypothetical protein H6G17_06115 [Chroococcidiopsis sp. FACHB-1243]|uniref:hypothetical protein n=1 Tax=Chroococcidiopsis sp. [FACHB-1243] TaxID=2692781 RepID=UPI00178692AC|nr:hypothetical protein [Chroococcidiopsis sp. [FACHB-1243]]MBD2305084.1 hypothetical protein [Chroococcidiopsis sp. [FACHB-1243]]
MNAKSPVSYPAVIIASVLGVLGLVGILLLWFQVSITVEPMGSDTAVLPGKSAINSPSETDVTNSAATVPPASTPSERWVERTTIAQSTPQVPTAAPVPGALRVSNQSEQPLRVALLARQSETNSTANKDKYSEPIHWDFAPGEGGSQGLILSLPQGNLKLKKGDIIVAFAEDGSRRYWGPYVVGETPTPVLDRKTSEWQLVLLP